MDSYSSWERMDVLFTKAEEEYMVLSRQKEERLTR